MRLSSSRIARIVSKKKRLVKKVAIGLSLIDIAKVTKNFRVVKCHTLKNSCPNA
jgi:hypothetical protein